MEMAYCSVNVSVRGLLQNRQVKGNALSGFRQISPSEFYDHVFCRILEKHSITNGARIMTETSFKFAIVSGKGDIVETINPAMSWRKIRRKMIEHCYYETLRNRPELSRADVCVLVAEEWKISSSSVRHILAGRQ